MEFAANSHVGLVRSVNEDRYVVHMDIEPYRIVIVADGMGGHQAGEIASTLTVKIVSKELLSKLVNCEKLADEDLREIVTEAILVANREVYERSTTKTDYNGMGTTIVAAIIDEEHILLAYIGDSRGYLLQDGNFIQLTDDHSLVNELFKSGQLTEEEAQTHSQRNIITRALGTEESVIVDTVTVAWKRDDLLLICSDGLSDLLTSLEIEDVLKEDQPLQNRVDLLITNALEEGGNDNITVVAVHHTQNGSDTGAELAGGEEA